MLQLYCRLNTNLFHDFAILAEYLVSAVNVVSSNSYVFFHRELTFLLSISTDEFISAPEIMKFFPTFLSVNINSQQESNPMP